MNAQQLIERIKGNDEKARAEAWLHAGPVGAAGVVPLTEAMTGGDVEQTRAAQRACWRIVRHAGRPGADAEKKAVADALIGLLRGRQPTAVRREVLWMLSEIGGDDAVEAVAGFLKDAELREDARMTLERIPGERSLAALRAGLAAASEEFKPNLAVSLRHRGVPIDAPSSAKLMPTRQTAVKPVGR